MEKLMKSPGTSFRTWLFLACLGLLVAASPVLSMAGGDTTAKMEPSLSLSHVTKGNGDHRISATLMARVGDKLVLLKGKEITFAGGTALETVLGKAKTNERGIATLLVVKDKLPGKNEDGQLTFGAQFEGDDKAEPAGDQLDVRELNIRISTEEADSVRTVTAYLFDLNGNGEEIPLAGTDISICVPRMFSLYKVGEGTLDSTGRFSVEFPYDLTGDSLGNITIIARIEDHELYGTAEGETVMPWGIPTKQVIAESYRALWSQVAPTWMVVTLIIMLLGVWGHYAFAIYKLVRIKRSAPKLHA